MKKIILLFTVIVLFSQCYFQQETITLTKDQLKDKIMGGWAGQTIGVTFGGPYEFRFNGTFIGDYQQLLWYEGYLKSTMTNNPGLFDDLYMDLTFVEVFEKCGLDAPTDSFAYAFANADYELWHANQVGRYNILNGIMAPLSGHWKNNPHADCIDYQIESDFVGLMSPGMPNTASAISDSIGHIMNYGDGWYGGVYVGAMYSLAFTSKDINFIVKEALKTIPPESDFYKCIADVIAWHKKYPADWKQTWFLLQKKWSDEIGCPDGVFSAFNIDAKVNAAYVVIGLLYGHGDFTNTLEISTRCGQDADCNASTAGGVLGTILGYRNIPAYWKIGLKEAEEVNFKYTSMSLNRVYEIGYKQAVMNIERNGGQISGDNILINLQQPKSVKFEKSFPDSYPVKITNAIWSVNKDEFSFEFEGTGFVVKGESVDWKDITTKFVYNTELYIDNELVESIKLPASRDIRRYDLCWKYALPKGNHFVRMKILDPPEGKNFSVRDIIIYSDKPVNWMKTNTGSK